MQASRSMPSARLVHCAAASLTLLLALTACGLKGPLYMPPPAPDASLTTPPAPATPLVPAPDDDISANTPTTLPVK